MLKDNIDRLTKSISAAKAKYAVAYPIRVVAATKQVDAETVSQLPSLGIFDAGENRADELVEKFDKVAGIDWHFIGALQTNKVRKIIDKVTLIHSVDRTSLIDEIDLRAGKIGKTMDVLLELNAGAEYAKSGVFSADELLSLADYLATKQFVRLKGIMAVLPIAADESLYEKAYKVREKVKAAFPSADIFSMGMSGDYVTAIKHGANLIRPGSVIFGNRQY